MTSRCELGYLFTPKNADFFLHTLSKFHEIWSKIAQYTRILDLKRGVTLPPDVYLVTFVLQKLTVVLLDLDRCTWWPRLKSPPDDDDALGYLSPIKILEFFSEKMNFGQSRCKKA